MTRPGIESRSPGPLLNTLIIRPMGPTCEKFKRPYCPNYGLNMGITIKKNGIVKGQEINKTLLTV